jgi:hypothetical protein
MRKAILIWTGAVWLILALTGIPFLMWLFNSQ